LIAKKALICECKGNVIYLFLQIKANVFHY